LRHEAVMFAELIIASEAQQDVVEAYCWYEDHRFGLGEEFLGCLDACIQAICRTPALHSIVYGEYRRALVRRFLYAVFFEYSTDTVTIYSIFHTSQYPKKRHIRLM